jgi:hypothetical protein
MAFERRCRARHAFARKLRGEESATSRCCRRGSLPHRKLAGPRLSSGHVSRHRDRDRIRDLLGIQTIDETGACRDRRCHEYALVPAPIANPDLIGKRTENFVRRHDTGDELPAGRIARFGRREHGREHVARMSRTARDEGVVRVEVSYHHRIGERRHLQRRADAVSDQTRARAAAVSACETTSNVCRFASIPAQRACDGVQDVTLRGLDRARAEILETK